MSAAEFTARAPEDDFEMLTQQQRRAGIAEDLNAFVCVQKEPTGG